MSDHHAATDPVDKAYVQSEALLGDVDARAARRARVLDAVAREPASSPPDAAPSGRRPPWRRGGWLAAAGVAIFCAFLVGRAHPPPREELPPAAATPAVPPPATRGHAAAPIASAPARSPAPSHRTLARARPSPLAPHDVRPPALPEEARADMAPAPASPAPPLLAAAPLPAPSPGPLAGPPPAVARSVVVTGARIARRDFATSSPVLITRLDAVPVPAAGLGPTARLHAAAAAGRTAEIEALLAQGVPVDAPNADGTTALMTSIRADQPAAAAVLRRHGASLDQKDGAGMSARDMATVKNDPALNQAIGVAP